MKHHPLIGCAMWHHNHTLKFHLEQQDKYLLSGKKTQHAQHSTDVPAHSSASTRSNHSFLPLDDGMICRMSTNRNTHIMAVAKLHLSAFTCRTYMQDWGQVEVEGPGCRWQVITPSEYVHFTACGEPPASSQDGSAAGSNITTVPGSQCAHVCNGTG